MYYAEMESPVGELMLLSDGERLNGVYFQSGKRGRKKVEPDWVKDEQPLLEAIRQLRGYFNGELREFDLELAPEGTDFQLRVWRELEKIPYGETISYGELARRVGKSKAARAVGAANGQNPIPIIIPCHRVIGSGGALTGYGGGLTIKEALLSLESAAVWGEMIDGDARAIPVSNQRLRGGAVEPVTESEKLALS